MSDDDLTNMPESGGEARIELLRLRARVEALEEENLTLRAFAVTYFGDSNEKMEAALDRLEQKAEIERLRARPTRLPDGAIDYLRMVFERDDKLREIEALCASERGAVLARDVLRIIRDEGGDDG